MSKVSSEPPPLGWQRITEASGATYLAQGKHQLAKDIIQIGYLNGCLDAGSGPYVTPEFLEACGNIFAFPRLRRIREDLLYIAQRQHRLEYIEAFIVETGKIEGTRDDARVRSRMRAIPSLKGTDVTVGIGLIGLHFYSQDSKEKHGVCSISS